MDAIEFEVIWRAVESASDEMCVSFAHSNYSTNIKTRFDLSCALLDCDGRVIGQSAAVSDAPAELPFVLGTEDPHGTLSAKSAPDNESVVDVQCAAVDNLFMSDRSAFLEIDPA
jgi:hypothetical protein